MALKFFVDTYKDNILKDFELDQNWQNSKQSFE